MVVGVVDFLLKVRVVTFLKGYAVSEILIVVRVDLKKSRAIDENP